MPTPDTGNWDLVVEVSASGVAALLGTALGSASPAPRNVSAALFTGLLTPVFRPTGVTLTSSGDVSVTFDIDQTTVHVTHLTNPPAGVANPPPDWLADIGVGGTVTITDHLDLVANAVVIDFSAAPLLGEPRIVVSLRETDILGSELVVLFLAQAFLTGGQIGFETARTQLLQDVRSMVTSAVTDAVTNAGTVIVVPAPPLAIAITASALLVQPASIHACYSLAGAFPGDVTLISRSMLLSSMVTGKPVDLAAIALSNAALLRDFVRPALALPPLALPASGFVAGHPCMFFGGAPLAVGGLPTGTLGAKVDSVIAGIDDAGVLHVTSHVSGVSPEGAFGITATVDASFTLTAAVSGGALTFLITPMGAPAVTSDLSIAWWVYLGAAFTGGLTVVSILRLADIFTGAIANGAVGTALAGLLPTITISLPLPGILSGLVVRTTRTAEPDSVRRMIGLGPVAVPDPFRSHDLIIDLV